MPSPSPSSSPIHQHSQQAPLTLRRLPPIVSRDPLALLRLWLLVIVTSGRRLSVSRLLCLLMRHFWNWLWYNTQQWNCHSWSGGYNHCGDLRCLLAEVSCVWYHAIKKWGIFCSMYARRTEKSIALCCTEKSKFVLLLVPSLLITTTSRQDWINNDIAWSNNRLVTRINGHRRS